MIVDALGVVAVVKGGIWLLDSTIWLQQPERRKKGEKGEQSNREYSSKVLASKDLHYRCNIIKGRLYMWTGLQKCQNRKKASSYQRLASSGNHHLAATGGSRVA